MGVLKVFVVPGSAPLLLSNRVNWALENEISCKKHTMESDFFSKPVPLRKLPSGHYEMDILDFPEDMKLEDLICMPCEDDIPEVEGLAQEERTNLRKVALSVEHLLTHLPKNPYCLACQRGKNGKTAL